MRSLGPLAAALLAGSLVAATAARAQERHEGGRGEGGPGGRGGPPPGRPAQRPAAPQFRGHPPGVHPHGPMVRPHPVRVLPPRRLEPGRREWRHWNHPEIARPLYYWDWRAIHGVTCVAEDSYGDQYPVTEDVAPGFGPDQMTSVEDDALDRCFNESGQDHSCYLATCSHY